VQEREERFMDSMASMMNMMSQFLQRNMSSGSSSYMPGLSSPVSPFGSVVPFQMGYSTSYPYMGPRSAAPQSIPTCIQSSRASNESIAPSSALYPYMMHDSTSDP